MQVLRNKGRIPLGIITLASFTLITLLALVANKPLPTGRALLPYWPLLVITLLQAFAWPWRLRFSKFLAVADVALALLLLYNTWAQIPFASIYKNHQSQWQLSSTALANGNFKEKTNLSYYLKKERLYHHTYKNLARLKADSVYATKNISVSLHDTINLAVVEFSATQPLDSLCKHCYLKNKLVKKHCYPLHDSAFKLQDKLIYYQYYGVSPYNSVQLFLKGKPEEKITIAVNKKGALKSLNLIYWEARAGEQTGTNLPPN